ncbi:MAG: hypothetical protein GX552_18430 [Chloroflexi bacterium]|jgi:hypothetical protein|nr:hypothetical protein [Chloroflexota bacterium]
MLNFRRKAKNAPDMPVKHHSIVTWERGHVRAAVLQLADGVAELFGVGVVPVHGVGAATHPDLDRWIAGCEQALTQAEDMTVVANGRKVVPDYVTMSIPATLTRGLQVTVSRRRKNSLENISLEEMAALLERGYRKAQDQLKLQAKDSDNEIVAGCLVDVSLDGHAVDSPIGLQGENLEARLHFCLAPNEWIRALELVAQKLELTLANILPEQMAYASSLMDPTALLLLFDEHHSITSMVRRGRLEWTHLVEMGEREIVASVAETLSLQGQQADALMRAYRARQLREDIELHLARAFWAELREWMQALRGGVLSNLQDTPVPHRLYFVDMTRRMPEAILSLQTSYWGESLPFTRSPEITGLSVSGVRNVLDCTAQAADPGYLALRTVAYYVAQLYASGSNLERTLMETIRWS